MQRQIINIRGGNASGKTTQAWYFVEPESEDLLGSFPDKDGKLTPVRFYTKAVPGLELPVHVIGTYDESKYSGCDKIKSVDVVMGAVKHATLELPGRVLFEGFRVSKSWGPYAELRNQVVRAAPVGWLWAMMAITYELTCERAQGRSPDRELNLPELAGMCRQMNNTRIKAKAAFHGDVLELPSAEPQDNLHARLVDAIARREASQ